MVAPQWQHVCLLHSYPLVAVMTQILTAAEARALLGGKKPLPASPVQRNPPAPIKDTKAPVAARQKPENTGEDETPPPTVAETHYIGRYQLNVANGTHYPGRMRAVLVGPADADLIKCLTAAINAFTSTP